MARLYALLLLLALMAVAVRPLPPATTEHSRVCRLPFCECKPAAHPSWTIVNCTVPHHQKLNFMEVDLPESTTDLIVTGAEAVMFDVNSLSRLKDARHIRVSGVSVVLMRQFAALNLNVVNVYLEIDKCGVLRIEERTFSHIKGPLSVSIKDCDYVSVEGVAFSWILTMSITNVHHLELGTESFMLDPTAANVGEHGPGMMINLKNLTVTEFPAQTFGSSAAGITLDTVEVHAIRAGAFSANTYNVVTAVNCSIHMIEGNSFEQKSLINNLQFNGCKIHQFASNALQSAVANLNFSHCRFENVETGSINATVASVTIQDCEFKKFMEKGFVLSYWNKFQMDRNSFDELTPHAIVAPGATIIHEMTFTENEIETANHESLAFIGQAFNNSDDNVKYSNNYYGLPCHCNVSTWLKKVLSIENIDQFIDESYCTVDEFFARCFNVPEQNMVFNKFLNGVCGDESTIQCEALKIKGDATEIKNPRFPHKKEDEGVSDRNKKVIGIVIVTCLGCVLIALFISLIRWMRRKGYCVNVKNFLISSNSSCGAFCDRFCVCGRNDGLDNARSISQLSVNEYSERHRLNEPRVQDMPQETTLPEMCTEQVIPVEDKTTQTLPEELTKELLENLREKLEDPENYVEAREMIEHLYELIKVEESCNSNTATIRNFDENIYELPFQNTVPRIGKNKKQMISVGTKTPSLEQLTPLSPYNRKTALAHEYFEPKDFAVHLYAEIANSEKEKKNMLGAMPDVVAEQAVPRGPYLRAVRDKIGSSASSSPSKISINSSLASPQLTSTPRSNKSTLSNSSGKMVNRPLPEKPAVFDPGAGPSFKHG